MYFYNTGKVVLKDAVGISGIIVIIGILLFIVNIFLLRDSGKAALITNILMCILLYFAYIEKVIIKIFPMLYYWHVGLICLFLLFHIWFFIHKKMPSETAERFNKIILVVFAGLILYNGIITIPTSLKRATQEIQNNNQSTTEQNDLPINIESKELPNVYYFIFDEYAGYDGILRYCDYDNIEFYNSLENLGFFTSKHSINGSIDTFTEIPNLLQLSEVNTVTMAANDKKKNFKDPFLLILIKRNGYLINELDSRNYEFIDESYSDYRLTDAFVSTYRTFTSYIVRNTAYYPFYGSKDQDNEINQIVKMFDYGKTSYTIKKSNLFTIGYFNFPHLPYIVDEYGNKTNDSDRNDLRNPIPYLGQFKYANKKILEMVSEIIENDPNSVIILQSDHGFRLPSHLHFWYGINDYDLNVEAQYEQNILNAVYYKGESIEIEGLSGLNTLKVVLNKLLETDFELNK
jgi:hypothetical protein